MSELNAKSDVSLTIKNWSLKSENGIDGGEGTTLRFLVTKFKFYDTFEHHHSVVTVARIWRRISFMEIINITFFDKSSTASHT